MNVIFKRITPKINKIAIASCVIGMFSFALHFSIAYYNIRNPFTNFLYLTLPFFYLMSGIIFLICLLTMVINATRNLFQN